MSGSAEFIVEADSLHRLFYNALQFDTKSTKAFLYVPDHGLFMNTSDGHVYIEDRVLLTQHVKGEEIPWLMAADDAKAVEESLRKALGNVHIGIDDNGILWIHPQDHVSAAYPISWGEWIAQSNLFDFDEFEVALPAQYAINPDRLRKLALLQPRDYPVDIKVRTLEERAILVFKKGPVLRGVYGTLDYDLLKKGDDNNHLW